MSSKTGVLPHTLSKKGGKELERDTAVAIRTTLPIKEISKAYQHYASKRPELARPENKHNSIRPGDPQPPENR